ncbi:4-hydroxythreonine-4-phosphate dehydrogenase [Pseudarthrobacter chlorophenolicus A6]|uniref:4-hydroxythreonine-4-phosphate dehydrogenase n=1 Tax=Pseudarthrobacter chlorophenolicus (strain ATCC 700700 / DSM 12829 / CIP 107037 / JCM 12360 / KCTC 9906 / NCIMB 13794 / A6) TaxID=452863 RepID=B8HE59_PSECP|nr:4-hydroxythreonine-4-phosphate dehydrogenase PdxA [Pseudarthrobacter chlorophenolicus]ACL39094.1 4-hydroxythreonine-4-phosphate dehydrogenase [Pseudarthrobacter chlorophenolicus A6]SDR04501.1 4-hydroxythreonine-4-phosphate dehydrogenase [Pseudarthrobacter chlorophenolicus]
MASVFVQADDFSGAAEVGSCFVQHGLRTRLTLGAQSPGTTYDAGASFAESPAGALVTDTHSRGLDPAAAAVLVKDAFSSAAASGAEVLFKKIDSLWRGNVSAEAAALAGLGYHVVVAGALPQLQRTVRAGRPFVAGSPLAETDLWQAEVSAPPADIPSLLLPENPEQVQALDLEAVRSSSVPSRLAGLLDGRPALVVADGETTADLEHVVDALLELGFTAGGHRIVLVGTGGAADVLAQRLGTKTARNAQNVAPADAPSAEPQEGARPVLAVVGSASKTAQAQLAQLEANGFTVVRLHPLYAGARDAYAPQLAQVIADLTAGARVVVGLAAARVDPSGSARIVQALSAFAAQAAKAAPADLILTGGETAREVLDAVGHSGLVPLAAVQHGAVLSRADDGTLVGTKPGSFGDDLALLQLYDEIRERRSAPAPATTLPRKTSEQSGATMTDSATKNQLPYVAVTMGDGAGVGPEVVVAAALDPQSNAECRPVVIGDALRLRQAAETLGVEADIQSIENVEDAVFTPGRVNVIDLNLLPEDLAWGQLSPVAGHAAYEYIRVASELAMAGKVQAICTAPLNKEALHAAGHIFPGHTELLAHLTGTEEVSMMLSTPKIRVIHVTTHIGLMDAIRKINPDLVERTIRRGHEALVRAGIPNPKIGVCAINPHAGENGLFGQGEEAEKIEPGVKAAQADGINAVGPLPADTLFFLAGRGDYDLVVAMYHDQGHGPVKVLGIEAGVNITVGLPVIRTSVDHGTAFDIAGKNIADSRSMVEALHQAAEMATRPAVVGR